MAAQKRLALVGYGKMGKLIDQLAPEYGFDVVKRVDLGDEPLRPGDCDVAIEFSAPHAALDNLKHLAETRLPAVSGTTGWFENLPDVAQVVKRNETGLVWSPNFSVGVAVFRRLVGFAAEMLKDEIEYGAWAWEIHHDTKLDAPSGTLLQMVDTMRKYGYERNIDASASRAGRHPGTHEIGFDSSADTLTLRHSARSREGFARGALKSANWIIGRKGVYTFDDVLFGTGSGS